MKNKYITNFICRKDFILQFSLLFISIILCSYEHSFEENEESRILIFDLKLLEFTVFAIYLAFFTLWYIAISGIPKMIPVTMIMALLGLQTVKYQDDNLIFMTLHYVCYLYFILLSVFLYSKNREEMM